MIAQENIDITPGKIRNHWEQVQKNWDGPYYLCSINFILFQSQTLN